MIITETARLRLRHFHIADGEAMDRVFGDVEVMRFGRGPQSPDWVRNWLRCCLENYHQKWGCGLWAVVERASQQTMGYCGLSYFENIDGQPETEIGYRLAKAHWGQGYATEAARAVKEYGFNVLNLSRLISMIDPRNVASVRVAEKIGLRYEKDAIFKEVPVQIFSASQCHNSSA